MANRRMFSKDVITQARFLKLPVSCRLLWYDLGMHADDDGFVESWSVMRQDGTSEADLQVLIAKGFVKLVNEDLVAYITDWNRNNFIRRDRYTPSEYHGLLAQLQDAKPVSDAGQPNDIPMVCIGKDSIGKYSLVEDSVAARSTNATPSENFELFWNAYPKKANKEESRAAFDKIDDTPLETILTALEKQKASKSWIEENGKFIPYPAKWLRNRMWENTIDIPKQTNNEKYGCSDIFDLFKE